MSRDWARRLLAATAALALSCGDGAAPDAGGDVGMPDTGTPDGGGDAGPTPIEFHADADPAERSDCTTPPAAGTARAKHVTCAAELVPGSLAMGRLGDVVIENARARFIVRTGTESATTIGGFGGGVVDAAPPGGVDQLKEVMPLLDFAAARASAVVVTDAGGDAQASVTVLFDTAPLGLLDAAAPGLSRAAPVRGAVEYVLDGDTDALLVRVRFSTVPGRGSAATRPGFVVLLGGNGEIEQPGVGPVVSGGSPVSTPVLLSEGAHESVAVGLDAGGATLISIDTIHVFQAADPIDVVAGAISEMDARIAVGDAADDVWRSVAPSTSPPSPLLDASGAPGDRVEVRRAADAQTLLRARFGADGHVRVPVAAGDYIARSGYDGFFPGADAPVTVAASGGAVTPPAPPAGTLTIDALADGEAAPVRVVAADPTTGDEALRFVAIGPTSRRLPPATYLVSISHGLEHDVAQQTLTLADGATQTVTAALPRVLDTTGYVSCDFHLHSDVSTDSLHHVEDAVRTIAAEGLELVASTDHDFITDYAPIATRAGVDAWIVVVPGDEVSTTTLGHIGGYPLAPDGTFAGAGAPVWFDHSPREIFDLVRARGDASLGGAIVQINHPRLRGTSFFDKVGLDDATGHATAAPSSLGLPATTDLDDFAFDVIEVWNGYTRGDNEASFADYLALTAAGRRFTMVGNSDSHLAALPAGSPRSFLHVPDDTRGHFGWPDAAAALHAHDVTVAAGIFVTADLAGPRVGDSVPLHVRVQAPPWIDASQLRVYAGRLVAVDMPIAPGAAATRFDGIVDVPLAGAPFVVVRVDGAVEPEPFFGFLPYGVTNAIDVP